MAALLLLALTKVDPLVPKAKLPRYWENCPLVPIKTIGDSPRPGGGSHLKSIAVIEQISKLSEAGHPTKKIAFILGISRNTVRQYLREEIIAKNTDDISPALCKEFDWKEKLG